MFIRKIDYFSLIEEDDLDVLLEDKLGATIDKWLNQRMIAAVDEVGSYLSHYYDIDLIFASLETHLYAAATSYSIGNVVLSTDVAAGDWYISKTDTNVGNTPASNPDDWKLDNLADPRSQMIMTKTMDYALYDINTRLNPTNIPDIRKDRRDEAERWLKLISKGEVNANLPKITPEEEQAGRIMFGGETKTQNTY